LVAVPLLLHRVWVVSQQHGNVIHAHMLLQKFDGKNSLLSLGAGASGFAGEGSETTV
jgi:hypothetical protein